MKIHLIYLAIIAAVLSVAFAFHRPAPTLEAASDPTPNIATLESKIEALAEENETLKRALVQKPPVSNPTTPGVTPPIVAVKAGDQAPVSITINGEELSQPVAEPAKGGVRVWNRGRGQSFEERAAGLAEIENPEQRKRTIQQLAWNVRRDTLATVDWAMSLEDPEDQQLAMEAINRNALVGIGAMLGMDDQGTPRIMSTLEQGAIASTGLVEKGDLIKGMVDADGSTIYFKGRPMDQIVRLLRGQPGTDVRLLMEREDGDAGRSTFEVPVQRSMLIMQPNPSG